MKRIWLLLLLAGAIAPVRADDYDPLRLHHDADVKPVDATVKDARRNRVIPIRVYLPPSGQASPVVLFSHGLGGSREGSPYLGRHWAGRGYVAVFLQHPGSDEDVWKNQPLATRMAALRAAASPANYLLRAQDVAVVLDQLAQWNDDATHRLAGRLDTRRVGMSGHSFGGQTTQAVSGQSFPRGGQVLTDSRIKAAIVMSPSVPDRADINAAFGKVTIPWLLMTGTRDTAPIGNQTVESRRKVFPALPAGDKHELVLDKAEHSAFTERALPGDREQRNPNHHRVILAISTAFWDAYLRNDRAAREWLTGEAPRRLMEASDAWQTK